MSNVTPTPVIIDKEQHPVPVIVTESTVVPPPALTVTKGEGTTLTPTTTEQEDIVTEGQRRINLIWETTQSRIALVVVVGGIFVNSILVLGVTILSLEITVTKLSIISICLQFINLTVGIVIGFYFSRINHQAQGGIGKKPEEPKYVGR